MSAESLRPPDDISQRLQRLAYRTGRGKAFCVRGALPEPLADLEDVYIAEQRLIESPAGRSESVPLERLMSRYGLMEAPDT